MITVAVLNQSTVLTDAQVASQTYALRKQVQTDLKATWGITASVYFYPAGRAVPPRDWQLVYLDDSDVANALGYHDLTPADQPLGKIFAKTDLDYGLSSSVTASHELLEMLVDPDLVRGAQTGDAEWTATEVGDPVEADRYGYEIHDAAGVPVLVSDFILPHWFQPGSPGPWDFARHLTAPLSLLPGGYVSKWTPTKGWYETYAAKIPDVASRAYLMSRNAHRRKVWPR